MPNLSSKKKCISLCASAERFVSQDYIVSREYLIGETLNDMPNEQKNNWPVTAKSKKELIYEMHFKDQAGVAEISRKIDVSHQYVSQVIQEIKKATGVIRE